MEKQKEEKKVQYLAIIFTGYGACTWIRGDKDIDTAVDCVNSYKQDWGHLVKFKKNDAYPVHLHILELENVNNGWESYHGLIRDAKTKKEIQFHKTFWVVK